MKQLKHTAGAIILGGETGERWYLAGQRIEKRQAVVQDKGC